MIFLVAAAFAQDLPWECPPIATAADAAVYRATDAGLPALWDGINADARGWVDDTCAWVETTTVDGDTTTTERVCETTASTVTLREWEGETWDFTTMRWSGWELDVQAPTGATWTHLTLGGYSGEVRSCNYASGRCSSVSASWTGEYTGLPDNGWFDVTEAGQAVYADTSGCSWRWEVRGDGDAYNEYVSSDTGYASVYGMWTPACRALPIAAEVNRTPVGAVDYATWDLDPADVDRDGFVAGCDCDDTTAAVSPYTYDIPDDGVDQDCDGADASDLPDPDTGAPDDTADDTGDDTGPAPTDTDPSDTDPADTDPADTDPADTDPADAPDPAPSGCAAVPRALGAALCAIPLVMGRRRPCGSRRA